MRRLRSIMSAALGLGAGAYLVCSAPGVLAGERLVVAPDLWDRPRSGRAVLEQPVVRQAVSTCLAQSGARLVIHHAAGQESLLQAEELRAWLIALAVEAERVTLAADLRPGAPLEMEMMARP